MSNFNKLEKIDGLLGASVWRMTGVGEAASKANTYSWCGCDLAWLPGALDRACEQVFDAGDDVSTRVGKSNAISIMAIKFGPEVAAVAWPQGHPVAKSIRRALRRLSKPTKPQPKPPAIQTI